MAKEWDNEYQDGYEDGYNAASEILGEQIAVLEAAHRWVPVGEGLPETPGYYLSIDMKYKGSIDVRFYNPGEYPENLGWEDRHGYNITHWMLLPAPPEDNDG